MARSFTFERELVLEIGCCVFLKPKKKSQKNLKSLVLDKELGKLRNVFPYSIPANKYRTEIPYFTKILYVIVTSDL